jgi:hypothetical protein
MAKVTLENIHETKTPKKDIDTPIATAFRKIRNYKNPLLSNELTRKRKRVKRVG